MSYAEFSNPEDATLGPDEGSVGRMLGAPRQPEGSAQTHLSAQTYVDIGCVGLVRDCLFCQERLH